MTDNSYSPTPCIPRKGGSSHHPSDDIPSSQIHSTPSLTWRTEERSGAASPPPFAWPAAYDALHRSFPGTAQRPVIGITGNYGTKGCELAEGYYESLLRAGAAPVVLPPVSQGDALVSILDRLDGLLLSGGGDLNPLFIGEEPIPAIGAINSRRDLGELLLVRMAADRQMPILGICRGCQMLAAALGGTLYQDLATQAEGPLLRHSQDLDRSVASHSVNISPDTMLHDIMGTERLYVNSFHHQAVSMPGSHLRVAATAPDGVIEAVESAEFKSILGVQWHPECFCLSGDGSMLPLFRWLCAEAAGYRAARGMCNRLLTLDSHCDTPMLFDRGIRLDRREHEALVDLHKMADGGLDATIMVAYVPQGPLTDEGRTAATAYAESQLTRLRQFVAEAGEGVQLLTADDAGQFATRLQGMKDRGVKAILPAIENGYAIGRDLSLLRHFRERFGIIYITLCHNGNNDLCGSARPREGEPLTGVTPLGAEAIAEMNRLGILVDLSHASEASFYDALDISHAPVACSHSSCRALCDHPRNLTDEQMRALASHDGVMQVTFYGGFLRHEGEATILDAVEHINHAVSVMGIEHVGIGSDFDGDGGVKGLGNAAELLNLMRHLMAQRYSEADLRLLCGGNLLRVIEAANRHS